MFGNYYNFWKQLFILIIYKFVNTFSKRLSNPGEIGSYGKFVQRGNHVSQKFQID